MVSEELEFTEPNGARKLLDLNAADHAPVSGLKLGKGVLWGDEDEVEQPALGLRYSDQPIALGSCISVLLDRRQANQICRAPAHTAHLHFFQAARHLQPGIRALQALN